MLELPCDWTVNRRPVADSHNNNTTTTTTPHNTNNSTTKNGEERATKKTTAAERQKKLAANAAEVVEEEEVTSRHATDDEHPLGPRSVLIIPQRTPLLPHPMNNVEESSSGSSGGQVKALVLARLQSTAESDQEARLLIDTESLISRLPYKRMLNDMFGGNLHGPLQNPTIPYVTRTYEESFMRERTSTNERECARGPQCEGMFIDRAQPFVAVEFLLPGESTAARTPHLCVLCCRATTQQLYYDVMFDKFEFQGTIQRFGNIHSQPGEYALDAMLIAVPSAPAHIMPLPIVSHQRNRYSVFVSGGIKRLRQTRVLFQITPLRSADDGQ